MRSRSRARLGSRDELARDHFKALLRRITVAMPVTPLLINNSRLVTYYNARASNWTVDHPCRRVPWLERTLTMGRRFLWIAHHDGVVCATGVGLLARAELAAQMFFAAMDEHVQHHNQSLPNFAPVSLSVDDEVCNVADLAFCTTALRGRDHPHNLSRAILLTTQRRCRERLIPSWITENWGSATTIAANATNVSTCGWAGNALSDLPCNSKCGCNAKMMARTSPRAAPRGRAAAARARPPRAQPTPTIAIHDIGLKVSTGLSLSEQTRRWGCLLDIRGNGGARCTPTARSSSCCATTCTRGPVVARARARARARESRRLVGAARGRCATETARRRRSPRDHARRRAPAARCASCWPSSARARTRRPPTRRARGVGSRCA